MRPCSDGKACRLKSECVIAGASLPAHVQICCIDQKRAWGQRSYREQLLVLEVAGQLEYTLNLPKVALK